MIDSCKTSSPTVASKGQKKNCCPSQLISFSSFCSVLGEPFCSGAGSSTMADFFVVPVGSQRELEQRVMNMKLLKTNSAAVCMRVLVHNVPVR